MPLASNRFAKYVVQQDDTGGGAPAPKPNRFSKYKEAAKPEPFVASRDNAGAIAAMGGTTQPTKPSTSVPGYRSIQTPGGAGYQRLAPTMLSEERSRVEAENAAEAKRAKERKESARSFGGGVDLMLTEDAGGNVQPGTEADRDISKGIVTLPARIERGVVAGAQSIVNLPSDVADFLGSANKPEFRSKPVPRADFSGAKIPISPEMDSVSGNLAEGLAQFLVSRKLVGSMAPGGGTAAQLGKDAIATGVGFDGTTGRVADMIDPNAIPAGPLRDYANFLRTQPEDSPLVGRFKNLLEDMTVSGPMLAPHLAVRGGQAVSDALTPSRAPTNAGGARPGSPRPSPSPAAQPAPATPQAPPAASATVAQPSVAQAPPRPAQAAPAGAGQGAAQAGPVLNATPAAVGQGPVALAKSDARIIGRLLRAGGVPGNDVNRTLTGLVQAYQSSNSSRLPLAFFAEEYLPTVLSKEVADEVIQKLRGFGRERYSANKPGDPSRSVMRQTIDELRSTQQDNLSGVMDQNLYKGKLIGQEDKLNKELEANARIAYDTALDNGKKRLISARATQKERDAFGNLQNLLKNEAFLKQIPQHLRIKAMREGIDIEAFVQKDPIASAHWLQSELRQAVDAAEGVGGTATSESRLYGEMRSALLDDLEKAVPGYKGARKEHGDIYGAKEAINFGPSFMTAARSEVETDRIARKFAKYSKRQQTAATMSIRDSLKNEFRNKAEDTAAKVTRLQQAGVLDALERVLGADGKRVADGIRATVKENERLKAVDQLSGSPTKDNFSTAEAAQEAVRSPVNKAIGATADKSSWPMTIAGDAVLAANGLPPVLTVSKAAGTITSKFGNPSAKKLGSATRTLYGLPRPQASALAAPTPRVRGPRAPRAPAEPPTQETLDALLKQYDEIDHAKQPEKAQATLRKITKLKKKLGEASALEASPDPALLGSSKKPPQKMGFGGGGKADSVSQKLAGVFDQDGVFDDALDALSKDNSIGKSDWLDVYKRMFGSAAGVVGSKNDIIDALRRERMINVRMRKHRATLGNSNFEPYSLPKQSGFTGAPEALGAGAGAVLAPDANGDGTVDGAERFGGMVTGLGIVGAARYGRGKFARKGPPAPKGSYGSRPSAMGDLAGHQAAQRQLRELEDYRKTAPPSEHAAVDQEIADLRGFLQGETPKPANDTLPKGQQTPAQDLAMARAFNSEPLTAERAYDFWTLLKDEADPRKIMDVLDMNLDPSILRVARGKAMVERAREEVLRRATSFMRKETELNKSNTLSRANAKMAENNRSIANEIAQLRDRGVPDQMIARSLGLEDGSLEYFLKYREPPTQNGFGGGKRTAPNPVADAEKILSDVRVASQLSPEQYKPLFDAVSARMKELQAKKVKDPFLGKSMRYDATQEGSDEIHRLNGLLMNYFRTPDGGMDFGKVFRWAEANDPDNVLRVKAGRHANDIEDITGTQIPKPKPAQNAFGFGGGKNPPPPPIMVKKGPRKVTLSPEEAEATQAVKSARQKETAARRRYVMRDNRDEFLAPYEKAVRDAEAYLTFIQSQQRGRRIERVERRSALQRAVKNPVASAVGLAGLGALAISASKIAVPEKFKAPDDPNDRRYYWDRQVATDKDHVGAAQRALNEWGNWSTRDVLNEKTGEPIVMRNGKKMQEPVEMTGTYGRVTKDAIKKWRYDRGLDPDEAMTKADFERLLAGPKGYWEKGHWHKGDGTVPRVP